MSDCPDKTIQYYETTINNATAWTHPLSRGCFHDFDGKDYFRWWWL